MRVEFSFSWAQQNSQVLQDIEALVQTLSSQSEVESFEDTYQHNAKQVVVTTQIELVTFVSLGYYVRKTFPDTGRVRLLSLSKVEEHTMNSEYAHFQYAMGPTLVDVRHSTAQQATSSSVASPPAAQPSAPPAPMSTEEMEEASQRLCCLLQHQKPSWEDVKAALSALERLKEDDTHVGPRLLKLENCAVASLRRMNEWRIWEQLPTEHSFTLLASVLHILKTGLAIDCKCSTTQPAHVSLISTVVTIPAVHTALLVLRRYHLSLRASHGGRLPWTCPLWVCWRNLFDFMWLITKCIVDGSEDAGVLMEMMLRAPDAAEVNQVIELGIEDETAAQRSLVHSLVVCAESLEEDMWMMESFGGKSTGQTSKPWRTFCEILRRLSCQSRMVEHMAGLQTELWSHLFPKSQRPDYAVNPSAWAAAQSKVKLALVLISKEPSLQSSMAQYGIWDVVDPYLNFLLDVADRDPYLNFLLDVADRQSKLPPNRQQLDGQQLLLDMTGFYGAAHQLVRLLNALNAFCKYDPIHETRILVKCPIMSKLTATMDLVLQGSGFLLYGGGANLAVHLAPEARVDSALMASLVKSSFFSTPWEDDISDLLKEQEGLANDDEVTRAGVGVLGCISRIQYHMTGSSLLEIGLIGGPLSAEQGPGVSENLGQQPGRKLSKTVMEGLKKASALQASDISGDPGGAAAQPLKGMTPQEVKDSLLVVWQTLVAHPLDPPQLLERNESEAIKVLDALAEDKFVDGAFWKDSSELMRMLLGVLWHASHSSTLQARASRFTLLSKALRILRNLFDAIGTSISASTFSKFLAFGGLRVLQGALDCVMAYHQTQPSMHKHNPHPLWSKRQVLIYKNNPHPEWTNAVWSCWDNLLHVLNLATVMVGYTENIEFIDQLVQRPDLSDVATTIRLDVVPTRRMELTFIQELLAFASLMEQDLWLLCENRMQRTGDKTKGWRSTVCSILWNLSSHERVLDQLVQQQQEIWAFINENHVTETWGAPATWVMLSCKVGLVSRLILSRPQLQSMGHGGIWEFLDKSLQLPRSFVSDVILARGRGVQDSRRDDFNVASRQLARLIWALCRDNRENTYALMQRKELMSKFLLTSYLIIQGGRGASFYEGLLVKDDLVTDVAQDVEHLASIVRRTRATSSTQPWTLGQEDMQLSDEEGAARVWVGYCVVQLADQIQHYQEAAAAAIQQLLEEEAAQQKTTRCCKKKAKQATHNGQPAASCKKKNKKKAKKKSCLGAVAERECTDDTADPHEPEVVEAGGSSSTADKAAPNRLMAAPQCRISNPFDALLPENDGSPTGQHITHTSQQPTHSVDRQTRLSVGFDQRPEPSVATAQQAEHDLRTDGQLAGQPSLDSTLQDHMYKGSGVQSHDVPQPERDHMYEGNTVQSCEVPTATQQEQNAAEPQGSTMCTDSTKMNIASAIHFQRTPEPTQLPAGSVEEEDDLDLIAQLMSTLCPPSQPQPTPAQPITVDSAAHLTYHMQHVPEYQVPEQHPAPTIHQPHHQLQPGQGPFAAVPGPPDSVRTSEVAAMKHADALADDLHCPITAELMQDPVIATDGHTYERSAISDWLRHHNTSPMTNMPLSSKSLIPNRVVKSLVQQYLAHQNVASLGN